jgi:hypothetical protein
VSSPTLRDDLREAGRVRAGQHGWQQAARHFADIHQTHFS